MSTDTTQQTETTLDHHLESFGKGDIDAILADYTNESVLCTAGGIVRGREDIRQIFEHLLSEMFPPGNTEFEMLCRFVEGEVAYIVWSAESEKFKFHMGTDTFLIRDGKILTQTYAAHMETKPPCGE